jgi:hypothetical protein
MDCAWTPHGLVQAMSKYYEYFASGADVQTFSTCFSLSVEQDWKWKIMEMQSSYLEER